METEHILEKHRRIWNEKKILREIYSAWYRKIIKDLAATDNPTIELGAGGGNFKQFKPDVIAADVVPFDWLDAVFDAHQMPYKNKSIGNIVMIDVLHHLDNPVRFLHEAARVLEPGGKLIMLEPYPSPFSLPIYRKFHPEPFLLDVDYFQKKEVKEKDPWDSNQAIPYLLFFKKKSLFETEFSSEFSISYRQKLSFLLYPASGGFENRSMIPDWSIPAFKLLEKILSLFGSLLAFRCYIILEKK